jgi:hypothetical protein
MEAPFSALRRMPAPRYAKYFGNFWKNSEKSFECFLKNIIDNVIKKSINIGGKRCG